MEEKTIKYYEEAKIEREEAIKRCGDSGCYFCSRAREDITLCDKKIKELNDAVYTTDETEDTNGN